MILGETMNSGSHKKDECASDNTVDVPKTMNVLKKVIVGKPLRMLIKLKCWLMPPTKFSSKKLKRVDYILIMFCMQ